ncbi:hypothetical protein ISN45_Aa06g038270 [Arabidopsis thaliana x Arabidopsis arenosa]|uniref:Uncharacterized protein n=1 Tax=Arabidopsis thaliana x Arabidopsis arenosa TaxID=1240361 RepID=A0A8T1Z5D8_9BRAS|nr:hypothetical protein ISN45_Aa06g038270 [Arabidopsis thaliana x Arabidopsis arenosa]
MLRLQCFASTTMLLRLRCFGYGASATVLLVLLRPRCSFGHGAASATVQRHGAASRCSFSFGHGVASATVHRHGAALRRCFGHGAAATGHGASATVQWPVRCSGHGAGAASGFSASGFSHVLLRPRCCCFGSATVLHRHGRPRC